MNKLSSVDVYRLLNLLFSSPDSRSACLPVLVITVHVFVFIVCTSLDGGTGSWHSDPSAASRGGSSEAFVSCNSIPERDRPMLALLQFEV
jgi:hypothetical protein